MLGFAPVSGRSVSGSPFSLVAVPGILGAAALALTFNVALTPGQYFNTSADIGVTFGVSATAYVRQAAAVSIPLTITLSGAIRDYGNPVLITGVPVNYSTVGQSAMFSATALADNFTAKGVK